MDTPAPDPYRLAIAAHELGHALAWRAAGFDIADIWVKGRGPATHGRVWIAQDEDHIRTLTDEHGVQTGLLAGQEAESGWYSHTGHTLATSSDEDMTLYRRRRRTRLGRQTDPSQIHADVRRVIRSHWTDIVRLAPQLAASGRLAPGQLPRPAALR